MPACDSFDRYSVHVCLSWRRFKTTLSVQRNPNANAAKTWSTDFVAFGLWSTKFVLHHVSLPFITKEYLGENKMRESCRVILLYTKACKINIRNKVTSKLTSKFKIRTKFWWDSGFGIVILGLQKPLNIILRIYTIGGFLTFTYHNQFSWS